MTFVFGPLYFLTYTRLFEEPAPGLLETTFQSGNKFVLWIDVIIFNISLVYQAWYWIFN